MRAHAPALLAFAALVACGGEAIEPEVRVSREVVDAPPMLRPPVRCEELGADERPLAVSPEGDLWLGTPTGLRVLGTDGEVRDVDVTLEGPVDHLVAWSDEVATAVIGGEAWRVEPEGARYLFLPEAVRGPTRFCGDLERDGQAALVSATGIYERAAGQWWALGPEEGERFDGVEWLATVDGACAAPSGGLWFGEGTSYVRVDANSMARFEVPEGTGPAVVGDLFGVAIPAGDELLFALERGPDDDAWVPVRFTAGPIRDVAGSANVLWVLVGNQLYRYDGEWAEADVVLPTGADDLLAHSAGGVWATGESQACHIGEASIRIRGVRPMEHFTTRTADLLVESAIPVTLRVDEGPAIAGEPGELPESWVFPSLALGGPGWHQLQVDGDGEGRDLAYRVMAGDVSWSADVRPIYETHCAGGSCHGTESEETVDLSTYDAWFEYALPIQSAVVTGRMPRDRSDEWSSDELTTITDWIDGGMQP
ncbi:MAG: hypothetical protein JJ863_03705 [Deltaproteobacteria bacterium]|nr:hypothetical protein [Deltaproteobacteria bacterium]